MEGIPKRGCEGIEKGESCAVTDRGVYVVYKSSYRVGNKTFFTKPYYQINYTFIKKSGSVFFDSYLRDEVAMVDDGACNQMGEKVTKNE